jgi:hypothetical protein
MYPMAGRLTTYEILFEQLQKARQYDDAVRLQIRGGDPLQPYKAGKVITNAYEQLRNATELGEGNITIQRAIRRFYKRALFYTRQKPEKVGQELCVELILGGYIQESNLGEDAPKIIANMVSDYADIYHSLRDSGVSQKQASNWILAILSVRTYNLLFPHTYDLVIAAFAYQYFLDELPREQFAQDDTERAIYNDALYVAVHQALLQSDIDAVRTDLLHVHGLDGTVPDVQEYMHWNHYAKQLYTSHLTLRLRRTVSKNGAPFRILRSLMANSPPDNIILNRENFLQLYRHQIDREYVRVNQRLNAGVIKSIVFLFLTKVMVGLAIEVPFDRYLYGHVVPLPLTINLLFPPLYMAVLRLGIYTPSSKDALEVTDFADKLLYSATAPSPRLPKIPSSSANARLGYGLLFLVPFVVTYFILHALGFNPLQMAIFVVFFSTASFLGYRLSHMVRELRMAKIQTGVFGMLWDLFYLPYILVGQWLASKYTELNVIGEILDLFIELPLKTVLSIIRQWVRFLSEKHEELY